MKVHDLKPAAGSTKRRKRVGRGIGGKGGKTAGRGTKGQKARSTIPVSFEGGQLPLSMRVPKLKGFNNPFRVEYQAINLDTHRGVAASTRSSPRRCSAKGLVSRARWSRSSVAASSTGKVTVKAHGFSKSAEAAITAAGGTVEVLPKPFGVASRLPRQRPHEPLSSARPSAGRSPSSASARLPFRRRRARDRAGVARVVFDPERLQGRRPSQQDPVHASHAGALPARVLPAVAGHRPERGQRDQGAGEQGGVLGFLTLFSGRRSRSSRSSRSASCRTSRPRSSCRSSPW